MFAKNGGFPGRALIVYLILFGIGVPWYWPADSERMLFGFPLWVVVSVLASLGLSCFTAWLMLSESIANDEDL